MNQPLGQGVSPTSGSTPSEHLLSFLKKPIILMIALFSLAELIISSITAFAGIFGGSTPNLGLNEAAGVNTLNYGNVLVCVSNVISLILSVITFIALSCIFAYPRISSSRPKGALTAVQAVSIVHIVIDSLILLLATLFFAVFLIIPGEIKTSLANLAYQYNIPLPGNALSSPDLLYNLVFVIIVAVIIIFLLRLIYSCKAISLCASSKSILDDRSNKIKGAGYIGVFNILICIFTGIGAVMGCIALFAVPAADTMALRLGPSGFANAPVAATASSNAAIISLVAMLIGFCSSLVKVIAAFGVKRHMKKFNGSVPNINNYNNYNNYNQSNNYSQSQDPFDGTRF